jgi:hypothetical protein
MFSTLEARAHAAAGNSQRRFRVGRDHGGRWVAVETSGASGGIFTSREAALHFAQWESDGQPGAVSLWPEPLELEI